MSGGIASTDDDVKLWHTKLHRENRFQTSRAQSKPKPKQNKQRRVSAVSDSPRPSHCDTLTHFSLSQAWANVHVDQHSSEHRNQVNFCGMSKLDSSPVKEIPKIQQI